MADGDPYLPFSIRPLPPPPPPPPAAPTRKAGRRVVAARADPPPEPAVPTARTAGRFRSPGGLLAFLGYVARLTPHADCRRNPDGSHWWGATELPWEQAAEAVWACGGRPFAWHDGAWTAVLPGGGPTPGPTGPVPDATGWAEVTLAGLLAEVPLPAGPTVTAETCAVVAPGVLARWVARRALGAGLTGTVRPVRAGPLTGGTDAARVLMRLAAASGTIPAGVATAVARLPGAVIATPVGGPGGRLLVDVRCRSPLAGLDLDPLIPTNEVWLLGAADVGHTRVVADAPEMNLADLVRPPAPPAAVPVPVPDALPTTTVPVRVVREPGRAAARSDAVLVDDAELEWLRRFLPARASGEVGVLLPGPGRHLLTGPGGLPDAVPFGVPLTRVGPGGLYLEAGYGFEPPLPPGARRAAYGAGEGRVVAVTRDGAFAFDPAALVPAWALWLGPAPAVAGELSVAARRVLTGVGESIRRAEQERAARERERPAGAAPPDDRTELLRQAMELELAGQLAEAAALLERAGEFLRAARLFERAAAEL